MDRTYAFIVSVCGLLFASGLIAQPKVQLLPTKMTVPSRYASLYRSTAALTVRDSVSLPQGFHINVFHAGMMKPRFFAWNPDGILHIVDMSAEAVFALPDRNGDGVADTVFIAAAPVREAHSVVFYQGAMLVAEPTRVLRFLDRNGDGVYETQSVLIDSIPNGGVFNHYTRTLLADTLRNSVYVSVGAPCDACRVENSERSAILRFNGDGSGRRIFATGLRNAIGMAIEPATSRLWATNADRNGLGEEKPEEIITSVPDGSFHGWPIAFTGSTGRSEWTNFQATPDYRAMLPLTRIDSDRVAGMKTAECLLPAHSTPMGIAFYTGNTFPPFYRNAAFVAVHGSFSTESRRVAAGYNVALMSYDAAAAKYHVQDFLSGFLTDSLAYKHWARPCGIGFSPQGDMFVSSDGAIGAIYRISYAAESSVGTNPVLSQDFPSIVSPNPSTDQLSPWYLDFTTPQTGHITLRIVNAYGQNIVQYSTHVSVGKNSLNLSNILRETQFTAVPGAYFYRLTLIQANNVIAQSLGNFVIAGR